MHSNLNYLERGHSASASRESHPELSKKISKLFDTLTRRNTDAGVNVLTAYTQQMNGGDVNTIELDTDSSSNDSAQHRASETDSSSPSTADHMSNGNASVDDSASNPPLVTIRKAVTNIPIRDEPNEPIQIPLLTIRPSIATQWLMLDLEDDFTHIFFPTGKKFLSLKLIRYSLEVARKGKTVLITQADFHPQVYATPVYQNKVFIGPYLKHVDMNIALFRRFNGRMMLLETFEKEQGFQIPNRSTGNAFNHIQLGVLI